MISELAWPPPPWLGVVPPQALAFSLFPGRARAGSWVLLLFSCHFCACFSKLPEQNWAETSSQPASAACWGRHWAACGAGNQPSALPVGGMQQPPGPAPCVEGCAGAVLAGGGEPCFPLRSQGAGVGTGEVWSQTLLMLWSYQAPRRAGFGAPWGTSPWALGELGALGGGCCPERRSLPPFLPCPLGRGASFQGPEITLWCRQPGAAPGATLSLAGGTQIPSKEDGTDCQSLHPC